MKKGLVLGLPLPPEETPRAALKVAVKVINEKGQAIKMARVTLLPARGKVGGGRFVVGRRRLRDKDPAQTGRLPAAGRARRLCEVRGPGRAY